jgi:prepilin peptidase CpaA
MSNIVMIDSGTMLLLGSFVLEIRVALLLLLLLAAVVFDLRSHRIPNWLVFSGLLLGVAFHTFISYGWGLGYALKGAAVGFGLFLPLYLLHGMGAGDVKLMAMVGAFLGPASALGAVLTTLIAGGALAIGAALWKGVLPVVLANIRFMLSQAAVKAVSGAGAGIEAMPASAGTLPYAVTIAAGTFIQVMLARSGHALVG